MNGMLKNVLLILFAIIVFLAMFYVIFTIFKKLLYVFTKIFYLFHDFVFSMIVALGGYRIITLLLGFENEYLALLFIVIGIATLVIAIKTKGAYPYDKGYIFACVLRGLYVILDGVGIGYLTVKYLIPQITIMWIIMAYLGALLLSFILSQNMVNIKRFEDIS